MKANHRYFLLPFWLAAAVAVILLLSLEGSFSPTVLAQTEHITGDGEPSTRTPTTDNTALVDPIPGGCPGNLPGDAPAVCCISGFVYLDGEPVAGAEVEIVNEQGNIQQLQTDIHLGSEKRPYYRLSSLSAPPLHVEPGDLITITARYAGQEYQIRNYAVQSGGQQVDLVLTRRQATDNKFLPWLGDQAEKGKFNWPLGLAFDSTGNLYIVDNVNARIQVFTPTGQFLRQWGVAGHLRGQFRSPTDIAIDSNDHVYVADMGNHRVQKFTTDGGWLTMWGNWGTKPGDFDEPYGVASDSKNNIYVTDSRNHRIQMFNQNGGFITTWGKSGESAGEFKFPRGIAIDQNDKIYIADTDHSRVQIFASSGQLPVVLGINGTGPGQFDCPFDIAVDKEGNLYVADRLNSRVQKFNTSLVMVKEWGKRGNQDGEFNNLRGIAVGPDGNIYVADTFNDRIQKFDGNGVFLTSWGSRGLNNGVLNNPNGVTIDSTGNLYVADTFNDRIQKFDSSGKYLLGWGKLGSGDGDFYEPHGVAVHPSGNVYVVDRLRHRIQIFDGNGNFINKWGSFGTIQGAFKYPWGILIDRNGNIYITDSENHRVQKFDSAGNSIMLPWGSQGNGNGQFNFPRGIAIDSQNNIYIADRQNHRIQKFTADGVFIRSFGRFGAGNGEFKYPDSVVIDGSDNIFVVDTENHRIQKLDATGNYLTAWGVRGTLQGGFLYPSDLVISGNGTMYVADSGSNRIFRSRPTTFTKPIATITHLTGNASSLPHNGTLQARGRGQDSDETDVIASYRWLSDKNGILGTSSMQEVSASNLAPGTHRLSLEVQDNEDEWSEPVSTYIYVAKPTQTRWTLLLYLVGDYDDNGQLMARFSGLLQTLRTSFNNPNVRIAIQIDGRANGDTRRLFITPGSSPQPPQDIGEQAMNDPLTLAAFISEGQKQFPADYYYLAIADHGQAIQGIGWDASSPGPENYLTSREIAQALSHPDVAPIHVLHLDGCSMNLIDVAYELRKNTQYLIASQYLAWSYFAYDSYQAGITATTTPEEFAKMVVNGYAQLARRDRVPFTLSALNLARAEAVMNGVDQLSVLLKAWITIDPNDLARRKALLNTIRSRGQIFNSNQDFLNNEVDAYVDLLDWVTNLNNETTEPFTSAIRAATTTLLNELKGPANISPFILANQAATNIMPVDKLPVPISLQYPNGALIDLSRAGGVSLYYPLGEASPPTDEMAVADKREPAFDTVYAEYLNEQLFEFTLVSRWNEFLAVSVGAPIPNQPLEPPPGPLATLAPSSRQIFLPLVLR